MGRGSVLAFVGKGGAGKTFCSAMLGKMYLESGLRVLFIDADPALGLTVALGISQIKTLGEAREHLINEAQNKTREKERQLSSEEIEVIIKSCVQMHGDFGLVTMGQSRSLGCFCALNNLLRETLKAQYSSFDRIIIDAEAGIEQINRQVIESVEDVIIVTDSSLRGLNTALLAQQFLLRSISNEGVSVSVIFNKTDKIDSSFQTQLEQKQILLLGNISYDPEVAKFDAEGRSLLSLPETNAAYKQIKSLFGKY